MPSLMGIDSDHPMSEGEVGKEGVAVDTLADMEILFDGIDIDEVSTSFTINPSAAVIYAMYIALADQQGVPRDKVRGTLQNDMLKEFIAQKEGVIPPSPSLKIVTDTIEFAVDETPKFHPVSISGITSAKPARRRPRRPRSRSPTASPTSRTRSSAGLTSTSSPRCFRSSLTPTTPFFEEIAKFRASRRVYARVMDEWYDADQPESKRLKFPTPRRRANR